MEPGTGYPPSAPPKPPGTALKPQSQCQRLLGSQELVSAQKGVEHRLLKPELLPVRCETVKVSLKDAYRIRRIYRRLAKMRGRGSLRRLMVFVRHENVMRLLEFLGYRQEE